ncbi:hypothetical protein GQR58_016356 [Nymphon striatum]|nr:hypothetical protein GQR58_016356 [Nymphon striatum]
MSLIMIFMVGRPLFICLGAVVKETKLVRGGDGGGGCMKLKNLLDIPRTALQVSLQRFRYLTFSQEIILISGKGFYRRKIGTFQKLPEVLSFIVKGNANVLPSGGLIRPPPPAQSTSKKPGMNRVKSKSTLGSIKGETNTFNKQTRNTVATQRLYPICFRPSIKVPCQHISVFQLIESIGKRSNTEPSKIIGYMLHHDEDVFLLTHKKELKFPLDAKKTLHTTHISSYFWLTISWLTLFIPAPRFKNAQKNLVPVIMEQLIAFGSFLLKHPVCTPYVELRANGLKAVATVFDMYHNFMDGLGLAWTGRVL